MNKDRKNGLTKEMIEENFIDENGCGMFIELAEYLGCTKNTSREFFKNFKIELINNRDLHISRDHIKLLNKKFLEQNYIDENGCGMFVELAEYLGCTKNSARKYFKNFSIVLVHSHKKHQNQKNIKLLNKDYIIHNFINEFGGLQLEKLANFINCSTDSAKKYASSFGFDQIHRRWAHYRTRNFNKLSKEFIIKNFIHADGYIIVDDFKEFINCSETMVYRLCRKFGVFYTSNPKGGGFNLSLPAILYYFQDTTTGYYKSGITNFNINYRFNRRIQNKRIRLITTEYYSLGKKARDREIQIQKKFKEFNITNESWITYGSGGRRDTNGATEFYTKDILEKDNLLLTTQTKDKG